MKKLQNKKRIKVICAMSGGVDSSVAAALLKKAGFEVQGVFMRMLDGKSEDEKRAQAAAKKIGITFSTIDLRGEFKKIVIEKFIADTKKGLTPNPCVVCNQEIKFGLFIEEALKMGADFVATGHYARIKKDKKGIYHLLCGIDKNKDQSYFLWRLNQKQLEKIIFPVGRLTKDKVRVLARKINLPSAETPESQEVCFANGDMDAFLAANCGKRPGNIINESGKIIGRHQGLWFYTIGQRKGIKLSGGPFYVLSKNRAKNELVVADSAAGICKKEIKIRDLHWLGKGLKKIPAPVKVRIRYRGKLMAAHLNSACPRGRLDLTGSALAPAAGQSAVFYRGQEVLGGGIID